MLSPDQLNAVCIQIQELQVHRKHAIKLENKCMNSIVALTARYCGYDANADENSRKKLFKRAKLIVSRGLKSKKQDEADQEIANEIAGELKMIALMMPPIVDHRAETETKMDALAEELPGGDLIAATPGFTRHGLAVIIGEAGNLLNYPSPACLWRRLGLGLMRGKEKHAFSTWRMVGGMNDADWIEAGYSPQRLAQIVGVVLNPLLKAKAKSKYGAIFARRRERTKLTHPEWYLDKDGNAKINKDTGEGTSAHATADAGRVMLKALIRDLWREWRRASVGLAERPNEHVPAASNQQTKRAPTEKSSHIVSAKRRANRGVAKGLSDSLPAAPFQEAAE